jgi:hypothetical protein
MLYEHDVSSLYLRPDKLQEILAKRGESSGGTSHLYRSGVMKGCGWGLRIGILNEMLLRLLVVYRNLREHSNNVRRKDVMPLTGLSDSATRQY